MKEICILQLEFLLDFCSISLYGLRHYYLLLKLIISPQYLSILDGAGLGIFCVYTSPIYQRYREKTFYATHFMYKYRASTNDQKYPFFHCRSSSNVLTTKYDAYIRNYGDN